MSARKTNLVLAFHHGRSIFIGDDVKITFTEAKSMSQIRVRIEAPENVRIVREEIKDKYDQKSIEVIKVKK